MAKSRKCNFCGEVREWGEPNGIGNGWRLMEPDGTVHDCRGQEKDFDGLGPFFPPRPAAPAAPANSMALLTRLVLLRKTLDESIKDLEQTLQQQAQADQPGPTKTKK